MPLDVLSAIATIPKGTTAPISVIYNQVLFDRHLDEIATNKRLAAKIGLTPE